MAAIFTKNKMIGWTAVVFALQTWLAETPEQKKKASSPAYFGVGMASMSIAVASSPFIDTHFWQNKAYTVLCSGLHAYVHAPTACTRLKRKRNGGSSSNAAGLSVQGSLRVFHSTSQDSVDDYPQRRTWPQRLQSFCPFTKGPWR
ncbi:hypothetical protein LTR04_002404 [Oleoguttula sp. CCFEE 6159]|nr:hypothetical protein LTR04_002404 [Oleoguttula sp. CCFEE 6159]